VVLLVRPREPVARVTGRAVGRAAWIMAGTALAIGAYDGFFGPGTGTFLIVIYVTLLRLPMARATADAKVVNFGSNVAAVAIFAHGGVILWSVALPMAAAQLVGGFLGAHLAVRRGAQLIRGVVLVVVLALVLKIARDLMQNGIHL
jgi:uncharacterized membrane protein YfcA